MFKSRRSRLFHLFEHQVEVDLYKLAVDGWVSAKGVDGAGRVYLKKPTVAELRAEAGA